MATRPTARARTVLLTTGITMEYVLDGPTDAAVVAFVHGLGANLHEFATQAERFRHRYRVLLLSLRGHGGTSNPASPTAEGYTLAALDEAPDARVVLLVGAGHFANLEQLERFNAILGAFLDDVEGRSGHLGRDVAASAFLHATVDESSRARVR